MARKPSQSNGKQFNDKETTDSGLNTSKSPVSTSTLAYGLRSPFVVNPYQDGTSTAGVQWYPYFSRAVNVSFTGIYNSSDLTKGTNTVGEHFDKIISPLLIAAFQRNITNRISITSSDIRRCFDCVTNALSLYYTVESILKYLESGENKNIALISIKNSRITSDILIKHDQLRSRLIGTSLPPRAVNIIKDIFAIYSQSDNPGSSLVQFTFNNSICGWINSTTKGEVDKYFDPLSVDLYDYVLGQLSSNSETLAYMNLINPGWIINDLPPAHTSPIYSSAFQTIWSNMCEAYTSSDFKPNCYPSYDSRFDISKIPYRTFSNKLDGTVLAFAAYGIIQSDQSLLFEPGIIKPVFPTRIENKKVYSVVTAMTSLFAVNASSTTRPGDSNFSANSKVIFASLSSSTVPNVRNGYSISVPDGSVVINCTLVEVGELGRDLLDFIYDTPSLTSYKRPGFSS